MIIKFNVTFECLIYKDLLSFMAHKYEYFTKYLQSFLHVQSYKLINFNLIL